MLVHTGERSREEKTIHGRRSSGGSRGQQKNRMYLRRIHISTILLACFMLTAPWSSALAQDEQKSNNRNSQSLSASFGAGGSSPNNDIYIDDEGLEGSGSRGEIRDDLEKEDDESSGSGYGDDDEDSSARGSSRSNSNTGISNIGLGGGGSSKGDSGDRSSSGGAGGSIGGGGHAGSGDHELDGREDDDEDDDLYTETKRPSIDLGPTDDEDSQFCMAFFFIYLLSIRNQV